jgi:histidyl-tRNA synthetase
VLQIIAMAADALQALGIKDKVSLELNTLGDSERLLSPSLNLTPRSIILTVASTGAARLLLRSRGKYRVALEAFFSRYVDELSPDSKNRYEVEVHSCMGKEVHAAESVMWA